MTDFDFEELDKAVSGALTNDDNGAGTPVTVNGASAPTAEPSPVTPAPSLAPAARRSSGRFMDMVHPTSDMRNSPSVAPRPTVTSRPEAPPPTEPVFSEPTPVETPVTPEEKPLESPFLPDAKVEKRPLGGSGEPAPSESLIDLLEEPEDPLLTEPDELRIEAHTMPDPIDFATQQETEEVKPEVEAEPIPEVEVVEAVPEVVAEEPSAPAPTEEVSTGPTSIQQQYEEQPSTTPEPGAMYDTESYHQPLAQPVKKKSGALIILWVLILVVLGAAAGAAFYVYVLPML